MGNLLFLILLPFSGALITMIIALKMKWMLEREVNNKQPVFAFHLFNVIFTLMTFGTISLSISGVVRGGISENGWGTAFLYAYVFPLPFLIITYMLIAPMFEKYMLPYIESEDSNIVYLKKRLYKGNRIDKG
ncbi:hypothetical protein [Bacillus sp. FJAT-44742]|uniref:hypothetical protein n=1 Tax=Bacillus sp. FJAT-44742 TaxID=2014005 RepID=UPI000C23BB72|nr:hypothetical protein [Bacillus sp. FJAT-44742]